MTPLGAMVAGQIPRYCMHNGSADGGARNTHNGFDEAGDWRLLGLKCDTCE